MMSQTSFRAWHLINKQMYLVTSIKWDPRDMGISVIIAVRGNAFVYGKLKDFVLMRKSSLTDLAGQSIYSGDILTLGIDSKFPGESFVVSDCEGGLCVNSMGVRIPLTVALYTHHAKHIGNIYETPELFNESNSMVL